MDGRSTNRGHSVHTVTRRGTLLGLSVGVLVGSTGTVPTTVSRAQASDFEGGDGSASAPYQIATPEQLQAIEDDLEAHYELVSDIDLSGFEFVPIAIEEYEAFSGVLDGTEHTISNVTIDDPDSPWLGVFRHVDDGTIRNVEIDEGSVVGNNTAGLLAGNLSGATIENVTVSGSVEVGWSNAGLLVGRTAGSTVTDIRASGIVRGDDGVGGCVGLVQAGTLARIVTDVDVEGEEFLGGVVGYFDGHSEIGAAILTDAAADGSIEGENYVGGVTGVSGFSQPTEHERCYAHADVTGVNHAGGVLGALGIGSVREVYAAGSVGEADPQATDYPPGGIMSVTSGGVYDSYWDIEATGQDEGVPVVDVHTEDAEVENVHGLTTEEMSGPGASATMSAFDFEADWETTAGYPTLRFEDREVEQVPGFDPAVHAFGFDNWVPGSDLIPETDEMVTHEPETVTGDQLEAALEDIWLDDLRMGPLFDLAVKRLYLYINDRTVTNGFCYGMAFTAQEYFESPDALPDGVESASEIPYPVEEFSAVGGRIDHYQTTQWLDPGSSESVFAALRSVEAVDTVDHQDELAEAKAAIDADGTVGIALGEHNAAAHTVLAFEYEGDRLYVYEPNATAEAYADDRYKDVIEVDGQEMTYYRDHTDAQPYDSFVAMSNVQRSMSTVDLVTFGYLGLMTDAVEMSLDAYESASAWASDHASELNERIRGVFAGIRSPASVHINVDGEAYPALDSEFSDPSATEYHDALVAFTRDDADIDITVDGQDEGSYTLQVLAEDGQEFVIDEEVETTIGSGDRHTYELDRETNTLIELDQADGDGDDTDWPVPPAIAGVGAAIAGVAGYLWYRGDEDE